MGAQEANVLGEIVRPFGEEVERLPGSG